MRIAVGELGDWIRALLEASGLTKPDAELAADIFLRASLAGQGHHDVNYLPQRLALLSEGTMKATAEFRKIDSGPAWEAYDGGGAMGEVCVSKILNRAMAIADTAGLGLATVRHSNHFLAAAPYAHKAAEAGYLAIVWSNTDPCMGDSEARARVIGNNPFGFGLPLGGNDMVFDACMAYASLGKLVEHRNEGRAIPPYWGKDADGNWTQDPDAILSGGVAEPVAGHKGFSQALLHEAITAGLSGGEIFDEVEPVGGWRKHSQTVLAVKLAAFPGGPDFSLRFSAGQDRMRSRVPGLRFPGERAREAAKKYKDSGYELPQATAEKLAAWSERFGVPLPPRLA